LEIEKQKKNFEVFPDCNKDVVNMERIN
jgi:hypothetical protein